MTKVRALLEDTRVGFESWYEFETEHPNTFIWVEGNFSCDCNRSTFIYDHNPHKSLPCNVEDNLIRLKELLFDGKEVRAACEMEKEK